MGLLDDYKDESGLMGIGMSPRPSRRHQDVMRYLVFNIMLKLDEKKFAVFTEDASEYKKGNSKTPDVIIYDIKNAVEYDDYKAIVIIEITDSKQFVNNKKKIIKHMLNYKIPEAFVFDYETKQWEKHSALSNKNTQQSFSDLLQLDFSLMVEKAFRHKD